MRDFLEEALRPLAERRPELAVLVTSADHEGGQQVVAAALDGAGFDVHPGATSPLEDAFCPAMLAELGPQVANDVAAEPAYASRMDRHMPGVEGYAGVPIELSDGTRIGAVCALSRTTGAFATEDHEHLQRAARELSDELELLWGGQAGPRLTSLARRRGRRSDRLWRRTRVGLPFALAALLAFASVLIPGDVPADPEPLAVAAVLTMLLVASVPLLPWARIPEFARLAPSIIFLLAIALLRDSEGGGRSGMSVLVIVPVLWVALHGSRRELLTLVPLVALTLLLPPALWGAPDYPDSEWRRGVLVTGVSLLLGLAVQNVVSLARRRAAELRDRARELQASEQEKRAVLAAAGDGVLGLDRDGRITFSNDTASTITGYTASELEGREFHELLLVAEEAHNADCGVCKALQHGVSAVDDGVFVHAEGNFYLAQLTVRPTRTAGEIAGAVITFADTTAERIAERGLLAEREYLAAVMSSLGEGIAASGPDGGLWLFNDAAREQHGLAGGARPERLADLARHLRHADGRTPLAPDESPFARVERGETVHDVEVVLATPGELPRTLVANGRPVHDEDGQQLGSVVATRDVTERRRAERLRDEFFALVSHELRTPLTSILGYLAVLVEDHEEEPFLSPEHEGFLRVISRNSTRLERLVGDLLFVAQLEGGRPSLTIGDIDLARVAADAVEAAWPAAVEAEVTIELELPGEVPASGDAGRLGQVVDNLLSNAIKFTPAGGTIRVALTRESDGARIEVADTGVGIPADELDRLFERFFRASNARENVPGIGLGLSISQAIVAGHGGTISVRSAVGAGTTFAVDLPLG